MKQEEFNNNYRSFIKGSIYGLILLGLISFVGYILNLSSKAIGFALICSGATHILIKYCEELERSGK